MNASDNQNFVSVDWGSSTLRLRAAQPGSPVILAEVVSPEGVGTFPQDQRLLRMKSTLQIRLEDLEEKLGRKLARVPMVISGMASSNRGILEVPYGPLPWELNQSSARFEEIGAVLAMDRQVYLLGGVCSETDIMRGEETEIAGLASILPTGLVASSLYVLPGTHSKHVRVQSGAITDFQTFMTGELFQLLSTRSCLAPLPVSELDSESLREGVRKGLSGHLTHEIFQIRVRAVLLKDPPERRAGLLIGCLLAGEISSLLQETAPLLVAANSWWQPLYRTAFEEAGLNAVFLDSSLVENASIAGHDQFLRSHCCNI